MGIRLRTGNFKSNDLPELELIAGSNIAITGAESGKEIQVTISASGGGSGGGLVLTPTGVKNSAYSAASADYVPVSTQFGAVTVTLPTAPADNTVIGVKMVVQGSTNAVTVAAGGSDVFNKALGPSTVSVAQLNQGVIVQYNAALAVWYAIVDDYTIPALDTLGPTTDITTRNASSTAHGLLPKLSNVITQFLTGQGTYAVPVIDQLAAGTDITTLNADTTKHGLMPKGDGNTGHFYSSDGTQKAVTATASIATDTIWNAAGDMVTATGPDAAAITPIGTTGQVWSVDLTKPGKGAWTTLAFAGSSTPWSTTLKTSVSSSATTATMNDALPLALATGVRLFAIIDAWTATAEMVKATVDVTGKVYTFGAIAHSHTAGASVIIVDGNTVRPEWWGALADTSASASTNVTAFNNMLTQLGAAGYSNPSVYEFQVVGSCGNLLRVTPHRYYPINAPITLFSGFSSFGNCSFTCTGDFGSGTAALDVSLLSNGVRLHDCAVISSNASMSMASFLSGGSNPPVAMDGFHLTERVIVERCVATGFRAGFLLDFADHSKFTDCHAGNNMYGYAFQHAGQDGGDMSFTKCDSDGAYRACWGSLGNTTFGPSGVSWRDCSWTNAPFAFFGDGGFEILDGQMINCNTEFIGNGFVYSTNGMIFWCNVHAPSTTVCYATGGTWTDPNFPGAAAFQVAAGDVIFRDGFFVATYPGGTSYIMDTAGTGGFQCNNFTVRTDTNGGPAGFCKRANSGSSTGGTFQVREYASGFANTRITGTLLAGDLCEQLNTSGVAQRYQTAGKPAYGFAFWDAINSNATLLTTGAVNANVYTGSVAAFAYVKPDMANPGGVVQAAVPTSTTQDWASIPANSTSASVVALAVTGAIPGEEVSVTSADGLEPGIIAQAWVSAANTVSIVLSNITTSPINPASHVFTVSLPSQTIVGTTTSASSGGKVTIRMALV